MVQAPGKAGSRGRLLVKVLRWVAFAACVALFIHALAKADLVSAWGRIEAIGPMALLAIAPFPCAMAMDAWAWKVLLAALDRKVAWVTLFKVRIGTEAITNSAPAGGLWADAIGPILVSRRTGIPTIDVFAAATAKRWTVVRMHSVYVTVTATLGYAFVATVSQKLFHGNLLFPLVYGAALFLACLSFGVETIAARGRVAERISHVLQKARFLRIESWLAESRHQFAHADKQLARLSKDRRAQLQAGWRMLGLWIAEGLESFLIFKLLGAPIGILEILAMDAALSVVRSTAMFAPAGIGVQDVGYLAVLEAYGVPDAASLGPAFIVLKRLKEAFWVTIGFVTIARSAPREVILHPEEAAEAAAQSLAQDPPEST